MMAKSKSERLEEYAEEYIVDRNDRIYKAARKLVAALLDSNEEFGVDIIGSVVAAAMTALSRKEMTHCHPYFVDKKTPCCFDLYCERIGCPILSDEDVEYLWDELTDVPVYEDENGELHLEERFLHFKAGTSRDDIWHWFDKKHSKGVAYLLYQKEV